MNSEDIFYILYDYIYYDDLDGIIHTLQEYKDFDINYHPEDEKPLIFIALKYYKYDILEYFLDYPGLDIHKKNKRGYNIFHLTILETNNCYLVQKMINLGIDVNQKTKDNLYPLESIAGYD